MLNRPWLGGGVVAWSRGSSPSFEDDAKKIYELSGSGFLFFFVVVYTIRFPTNRQILRKLRADVTVGVMNKPGYTVKLGAGKRGKGKWYSNIPFFFQTVNNEFCDRFYGR